MHVASTDHPEVKIFEPRVYEDQRGFFFESFNAREFSRVIGRDIEFVQDNHSRSCRNVLRGLHYQIENVQGKLVRVVSGEIFDVAVDIRRNSPNFKKWVGVTLSAERKNQLWVPEGFAHGFLVLSEIAEVIYKTTDYYNSSAERCIKWNDPDLAIEWPIKDAPIVSEKDANGKSFSTADLFQ